MSIKKLNEKLEKILNENKHDTNLLFPARGYRVKDHELSSGAKITTIWWRTQKEGIKQCNITYYLGSEHHTGSNHIYIDLIGDSLNNKPAYFQIFFPSTKGNYTTAENYNLNELKNIEDILKDKSLTYNKEDIHKFLDFVNVMQSRINKLNLEI
jgi:hypothetical protein